MGTTADKLARLNETKSLLKTRLTEKGLDVASENNFYNLADKVGKIQVGVDTSDATATADKILKGYTAYVNGVKITGTLELPPEIGQLGTTINLFGYDWLVAHKDSNYAYLITKDVIKHVQWNTTSTISGGYASSNIKKECTNFAKDTGIADLSYVVDTGVGKVFIPTKEQLTGGFSWFNSNERRIAKFNGSDEIYWTATPSTLYAWLVLIDGSFTNADPSNIYGFRPCIAIKYQ